MLWPCVRLVASDTSVEDGSESEECLCQVKWEGDINYNGSIGTYCVTASVKPDERIYKGFHHMGANLKQPVMHTRATAASQGSAALRGAGSRDSRRMSDTWT